ncbi:MarR family winged helix-turn-helix transcriptional regulator [Nocardia vermiculata]|uniref:Winged helix-turn-helix transcriptional regulator n=1 Tax=Nocardia vermiculata TaxID=257274 RepID=A0A846Y076_9NOCA|nr:MarR family winged helix-turn-helix transcriptional regulator [Nocardia vermiculata]NKY49949.1 winged helix-turn-helix transcriptional regulator [Nocardia vermiculata]
MENDDDLRFDIGPGTPDRLKGQLSRLLGMTATQTARVAGNALRAAGAHKDHFIVLAALDEQGPASQATLSDRTRVYKSDLVAVLNTLESHGWVHRTPDPKDKRRNIIDITESGGSRLKELGRILDSVNAHIMAPLDPTERARLFDYLGRINTHLVDPPE